MRLEQRPTYITTRQVRLDQMGDVHEPRPHDRRTRGGQVIVLFALLIPVIFAIGSIVMARRELVRAQAASPDAGRLSCSRGAQQFTQCARDPAAANLNIRTVALGYAGDTLRPGRANPLAPLDGSGERAAAAEPTMFESS